MEFQEVVRRRKMIREFHPTPVPDEVLSRILDNATRAPSAGFSQGMAFLVLTGDDLPRFWEIGGAWVSETVRTAPVVIVPMSSKRVYLDRYAQEDKGWTDRDETRWPVPFWHIDTGMAAMLILQTAVDQDLGAIYFGIAPEAVAPFRKAYGVPEDHEPIGAIAIGTPAAQPDAQLRAKLKSRRRPLEDVVHHGRWRGEG
ncbi:nitroreductase family protein [Amycolatopsis sp. NPDC051071]|uniref:nitroreductase family protein n=1 Tax=Amycolatopsis sp. NPDC051071 TaxID=3154637 RepID=UPI00342B8746